MTETRLPPSRLLLLLLFFAPVGLTCQLLLVVLFLLLVFSFSFSCSSLIIADLSWFVNASSCPLVSLVVALASNYSHSSRIFLDVAFLLCLLLFFRRLFVFPSLASLVLLALFCFSFSCCCLVST